MYSKPLISIIIPVYKVELYIEKCIRSVLAQTYDNFEVIIVDDGSPDDSIRIAKKVIGNDSRFVILKKENGGVPSARNLGIDFSTGAYLAFLDSDDYYESEYLELMYKEIVGTSSDICTCNINVVKDDSIVYKIKNDSNRYKEKNDYLLCMRSLTSFSWDKLYKRSVFDGMRFDENIKTYEDSFFIFKLIYGKKICSVESNLYNYVQRRGSITKTIDDSYFLNKLLVMKNYIDFYNSTVVIKKDKNYLIYCYLSSFVFASSIDIVKYSSNPKKDLDKLLENIERDFFNRKNILKFFIKNKKQGMYVFLLYVSKNLFLNFFNFKKIIK